MHHIPCASHGFSTPLLPDPLPLYIVFQALVMLNALCVVALASFQCCWPGDVDNRRTCLIAVGGAPESRSAYEHIFQLGDLQAGTFGWVLALGR